LALRRQRGRIRGRRPPFASGVAAASDDAIDSGPSASSAVERSRATTADRHGRSVPATHGPRWFPGTATRPSSSFAQRLDTAPRQALHREPMMIEAIPTALHRGDDSLPWVDLGGGIEIKVLQVKIEEGLWVIRNRFAPGANVQTHRHTGSVYAFTTRGAWRYRESDFMNVPGSFLYEPAGSVHTLTVPESNTEPTEVFFAIWGANLNLDANGNVEMVIDAQLVLSFYLAGAEAAGLPKPDVIIG
jgi:2,4'-dihydroxyacetophenone dioxygenase